MWTMGDGGSVWAMREGAAMPATADAIKLTVGDRRRLVADFGNLAELDAHEIEPQYDEEDALASPTITVSPGSGVTVSGLEVPEEEGAAWYAVAAWYTATSAGEYVVTVAVTLDDGTILKRKAALVVE